MRAVFEPTIKFLNPKIVFIEGLYSTKYGIMIWSFLISFWV